MNEQARSATGMGKAGRGGAHGLSGVHRPDDLPTDYAVVDKIIIHLKLKFAAA